MLTQDGSLLKFLRYNRIITYKKYLKLWNNNLDCKYKKVITVFFKNMILNFKSRKYNDRRKKRQSKRFTLVLVEASMDKFTFLRTDRHYEIEKFI